MRSLIVLAALILTPVISAAAKFSLADGTQDLVRQIVASMEQQQKRKLAVLDLSQLDGSVSNFGRYLSERLITQIFLTRRFEVIERRQLDRLLAELRLNLSDLVDPQNAKRLGKVSGVDSLLVGSVAELTASIEVNARLIETETGRVFAVASTMFAKGTEIASLLGGVSAAPPRSPTSSPSIHHGYAEIPYWKEVSKEAKALVYAASAKWPVFAAGGRGCTWQLHAIRNNDRISLEPETIREIQATEGYINQKGNKAVVVLRNGRRFDVTDVNAHHGSNTDARGHFLKLCRIYWDDVNSKIVVDYGVRAPEIGVTKLVFLP